MRDSSAFNYPPLGLLYLAANLPSEYECRIIDAPTLQQTPEDCLDIVKDFKPAVVGISVFSDSLFSCKLLAE
jgi:hypothetical protein